MVPCRGRERHSRMSASWSTSVSSAAIERPAPRSRARRALAAVLSVTLLVSVLLVSGASAQTSEALSRKFNFEVSGTTTPAGFTRDLGDGFTPERGFGWIREDTARLEPQSHAALSIVPNARQRSCTGQAVQDVTLQHMQFPPTSTNTQAVKTPAAWDVVVPNGVYDVTVAVGEPAGGNDPEAHVINVEGVQARWTVNGAQLAEGAALQIAANGTSPAPPANCSPLRHGVSTLRVPVTDGRLTVDAIGGTNTKLKWVEIVRDVTAPAAPGSFAAAPGTGAIDLSWTAPADSDLAGYLLRIDGGTPIELPAATTSYQDTDVTAGATRAYELFAVDTAGNSSAPATASAATEPEVEEPTETPSPSPSPSPDADTTAPAAPADLTAAVADGAVQLSWAANTEPDLDGYLVLQDGVEVRGLASDAKAQASYTATGLPNGTAVDFSVIAVDTAANESAPSTVTATPLAPTTPCTPYSPLECDEVPVDLPLALDFDGTEGALDDTGFTMVQPSTTGTYKPEHLAVADGALAIEATKGIQFRVPGRSTNVNSLDNGLGVGFATPGGPFRIATTVSGPAGPNAEQAGLWFGHSEDDYVKIVYTAGASSTAGKINFAYELGGGANGDQAVAPPEQNVEGASSGGVNVVARDTALTRAAVQGDGVQLFLDVDPATRVVTASYQLPGGAEKVVGTFTVTPAFVDGTAFGADSKPAVTGVDTYAGVYASSRNRPATAVPPLLTYRFGDFSVTADNAAPVMGDLLDDAGVVGEAYAGKTLTATDDAEGVTFSAEGLPPGLTLDGSTISGTPTTVGTFLVDVTATDAGGLTDAGTYQTVVTAAPDTTPPAAPVVSAAVRSDGDVDLLWSAVEDAVGYRVHRSTETPVATTGTPYSGATDLTATTFRDLEPVAGTAYRYVVVAVDATGNPSAASNEAEATVPVPPATCSPYSTLLCEAVAVDTPFTLDFLADAGGYDDAAGVGTGFTSVQPSSVGGAHEPSRLAVGGGALAITASPGIQYKAVNTLDNGLQVGVDASAGVTTIEATVVAPTAPASNSQQVGLFLGPDEDDYVKLVVAAGGSDRLKVQLLRERDGASATNSNITLSDELNTGLFADWDNVPIRLVLEADAATDRVTGFYSIDGGPLVQVAQTVSGVTADGLTVPAVFDAALSPEIPGASTFAGVFATKRNSTVVADPVFQVNDFSVDVELPNSAPVVAELADETAIVGAPYSRQVTASDADEDAVTYTATGLPAGVTVDGASGLISGTPTTAGTSEVVVTADDGRGGTDEGAYTLVVEPASAAPLSAPTGVTATASSGQIVLAWAQSPEDVAGYNVYLREGATDRLVAVTGASRLSVTFGGLVNGTTYTYVVVARGTDGQLSAPSAEASATPLAPGPTTPAGVTLLPDDNLVAIEWEANDPEQGVVSYEVFRTAPTRLRLAQTADTFVVDLGARNGTTYSYSIVALDDQGRRSPESAPVSTTPPDGTPPPADDTTAPGAPANVAGTPGDTTATITWSARPADEGATAYRVYRDGAVVSPEEQGLLPSFADSGLTNGTDYVYEVTAVDAAGNESARSTAVTVTPAADTEPEPPAQPCTPWSVLPCGDVAVDAPYAVDFESEEDRGLDDADGQQTGFTMVQPASHPAGTGGYVPANLDLDAQSGQLRITTTNGIQYKLASDGSATQRNNGLQNALGVGVDATDDVVVRTTVLQVPPAVGSNSEQAGLWLGPDEDTYTKLVVSSAGANLHRIQLMTEADGLSTTANEVNVSAVDLGGRTVTLELRIDQSTGAITGSYGLDGGALQPVSETRSGVQRSSLPAPSGLLDEVLNPTVPGATTFAGIFATHRNRTEGVPLTYRFADFAVADDGTAAGGPVVVPEGPVDVRVNFQSAAAPVAAGYLRDFGQPFGSRTDADQGTGLTYGWVRPLTQTPLDLSVGGTMPGNGRDRDVLPDADQRWDTFVHAQGDDITSSTFNGTPIEGAWQLAVPNGRYRVTVGVGDPVVNPSDVERHVAVAEDVVLVAGLEPTGVAGAETRRASGTAVVEVTDQTLTLDAASGVNSKFAWVEVVSTTDAPALKRPRITNLQLPIGYAEPPATAPADGAVGVATTTFFSPTFVNANGGIDRTTLTAETVRLVKVSDGSRVLANVGTSGGTDVITLSPSEQLTPNTQYRYEVTSGVRDLGSGSIPAQAFLPYSATFTTGAAPDTSGGEVGFDMIDLPAANGAQYTSLAMGPDGQLYASTNAGTISRFPINADGTLGAREDFDVVKVNNGGSRLVVGLTFDPASTATAPILWVTHTDFGVSNVAPQWGGKLSRISGAGLATYEDYVVGLPRSKKDHVTNSIDFGPDGAMYINQGSNAAAGAPDSAWGFRAEELLTASVLRVDPTLIPAGSRPLNAQTARTGSTYGGPLYDPYAPGAAVTLHATGIRNAYDLIWHSNGQLYVPSNGTAAGGNTPAGPGSSAACAQRGDGYTGAGVPGGTNFATQREFLFRIEQGGYYGHPNPLRCEFVMNGGNPAAGTDVADTGGKPGEGSSYYRYPEGTQPDPNFRGFAHDFLFNNSPNGVIEYAGGAFGGALQGRLIVARYSGPDDLQALTLSADGTEVVGTEVVYGPGNGDPRLNDPLDVVEGPGGALYVTEYSERTPANARLRLLRPRGAAAAAPDLTVGDTRVVLNDTVAAGASAPQTVTLSNPGSAALQVTGLTIGGTNGARFALAGAPTLPLTLQPGESRNLSVTFTAAAAGPVEGAALTIASNDPTAPSAVVELRGLGTLGLGGGNEPSLQWILDAHDVPVTVGDPDPTNNALPATGLLGQEVHAQRFVRVAERPVTVEPLAVFGPQDTAGTVTRVGWYPVATPGTDNALFSVPNDSYQSVAPSTPGTLSFDPGVAEFGLSSTWPFFGDRRVASQDALNTWETVVANRHKVRAYPFRAPDGTVEPNAYVIAFEEHVSGYDYQDVVFVLRNVAPAGAPELPEPDVDELIFDAVKGTTAPAQTVTLTNSGDDLVTVIDVALGGANAEDFDLVAAPADGTAVPAGQSVQVQVGFSPAATAPLGYREAALTVVTDAGSVPVGAYGLTVNGLEGGNEPPLDAVVRTLGHPIDVGGTGLIIGTGSGQIGDEQLIQQFQRAGAAAPTITPVARYSPDHSLPFGFYTAPLGDPIETLLGTVPGTEFQTLLPQPTAPFDPSFDPGAGSFGIYVQGINARKTYQQDALNAGGPVDHAVRVYPLIDRDRKAIANTYLVAFEDASNGDYQDYVFVVTGVRPAGTGGATAPGEQFTAKVNFGPADTPAVPGYQLDTGAAYSEAAGSGWVSLDGTTPLNATVNTRLRAEPAADARLRSLLIMNDSIFRTGGIDAAYEMAVPDGTYTVALAVGDASFYDSAHQILVEGTPAFATPFAPTAADPHEAATVEVEVTDGRLTLTPATGSGSKLNYVEITGEAVTGTPGTATTVNFQPEGAPTPEGEIADVGQPFSATRGFGWVDPQSGAPVDMTANTRQRTGTVADPSLLGIVLMQGLGTTSQPEVGNWRATVPNGAYDVTVAAGDAAFLDSVHAVDVEGVRAVDDFAATETERFSIRTVRVDVTDGALDVTAPRTLTGDLTANPPAGANNNTKLAFVSYTPIGTATPDTTAPTAAVDVTGLVTSSGAYRDLATVSVTAADAGGSGLAAVGLSVNDGPFTPYTEPLEITDAGSYTVRARAVDGAGNLTTSAPRSFAVVTPPPSLARIDIENLDVVPYDDRLVFNRIQNPSTTSPNEVHDEATLRITNTGTEPLNVTGLGLDTPTEFTVLDAPALPAVVAPGADLDVVVQFVYSAAGSTSNRNSLRTGTLTIGSDDPTQRELAVELAGVWQWRSENGDEPELDEVLAAYGLGSNVPGNSGTRSPSQSINTRGELTTQGDEILSPYWRRANTSQPARVTQLAAFHTQGNGASVFWTPTTSASGTTILRHAGAWGQSFYPQVSATVPGAADFTPSAAVFGLKSDPEHSDRSRNNNTIDTDQGCIPLCGHHYRMFVARDRTGAVIPNTYIGTMDYAGINYDFQDNIYLFENLAPELAQVNPAASAPLPGAASLTRTFDAAVAGTLDGTGFTATQPNCHDPNVPPGTTAYEDRRAGIESTPVGLNTAQTNELTRASCPLGTPRVSFQPGLLDVAGGALAVTTFGTIASTGPTRPSAGTNGGLNNTLVNGLTQPFDASSGTWTASTRILGPLGGPDGLTSGSRQGGVMVGTDQDNFVKLAIIGRGSPATPSIELFAERDRNTSTGAGNGTIGATPALPSGGAVAFVDLHLTGDPSTGRITASYSVDGGAPVQVGSLQLTPAQVGRFFDRNVDAGLIAQSQNATPTTVRFDSFSVTRGLPAGGTAPAQRDALHRLDVGTPAGTSGTYLGVPWTSDAGFFSPASAVDEGAATGDIAGVATADMPLYRTYRGNVGNVAQTSRTVTYELPTRGLDSVDLRLHFADRFFTAAGQRVFDIEAEGRTLRAGFDIVAASGAKDRAVVLELNDVAVADGSLTLAFDPSVNYASIAAIEVLCDAACPGVDATAPAAPTNVTAMGNSAGIALDWPNSTEADLAGYHVERASSATGPFTRLTTSLLTTSAYTDPTAPAGATSHYRVLAVDTSGNASAPSAVASAARAASSQQPIRINAGGPATTVGGTGWLGCATATTCGGHVAGGIPYTQTGATVSGLPATISSAMAISEWTGGATTGTPVGGTAFAYDVPVANGEYSLVLHFAELNKNGAGLRVFDVEVENVVRLANYDIFARTGYRDHIAETLPVTVTDGKLTIEFIRRVENAKVTAIEIIPAAPDTTAPPAPASLSATAQAGGIALDWPDVTASDLAGYRVERLGADNQYAPLATTAAGTSAHLDATAPAGATSTYRVLAVDHAGNASAPTAPASATRPGSTAATYTQISWTSQGIAAAPFGNSEGQAEVVGATLYTFGGFDSQKACCTPTSRAFAFDPAANSWTPLAPMPRLQDGTVPGGVTHAGIATDGTNLFIASGYTANAAGTGQMFSSDEVWRYNVAANSYTRMPDLPAANAAGQLELLNGKLHYFGGTNPGRTADVGAHWVYDLAQGTTGTWTSAPALPNPRHHMGSAVLDGKLYAIGGQHGHDGGLTTQNDVHVYDPAAPAATAWTQLADLPSARGHIANSTVVDRGRILVMGGESSHGGAINLVSAFDPATNAWTPNSGTGSMSPLPANRVSGNAGVVGGILYFTTGGGSAVTYRGTPQGVTTPPPDTTRPTVTASTPANGATGVAVTANATATFSEAMSASAVEQAFTLAQQGSATNVPATVTLSGSTATLNPTADLAAGTTYVATVGTAAADTAGNTLSAPSTWTFTTAGSAPQEPGQAVYRINAGGPTITTGGTTWQGDAALTKSGTSTAYGFSGDAIAGTTDDVLFQTERYGKTFGYDLPVADGEYRVNLLFSENWWGVAGRGTPSATNGNRVFSANLEGGTVELASFDIRQAAGSLTAVTRSYDVTVTDGKIDLDFTTVADNAKISAIEVLALGDAPPPPPPVDDRQPIRINAGGPGVTADGVAWEADRAFSGGRTYTNTGTTAIAGTTADALYLTERSAGTDLGSFSYAIPVAAGDYDVRLHFAEIYFGAPGGGAGGTGKRVLSATAEGQPVVTNLDLNAVVAPATALVRSRQVSVTDGTLNLAFSATVNQPKVSAIELIPVSGDSTAPPTGESQAGEPLPTGQRFNAGGPAVTTGGATWAACTGSCDVVGGGSDIATPGSVAGLVVPTSAQLFGTATTGPTGAAGSRAFGFDFFRPNGAYTVRVHLADQQSTAAGQRVFHVDVDGARRTTGLDLFARAGGQGRATWIDYEVSLADGKLDLDLVRQVGQPLVNAVEILDGHGLPDPAPLG